LPAEPDVAAVGIPSSLRSGGLPQLNINRYADPMNPIAGVLAVTLALMPAQSAAAPARNTAVARHPLIVLCDGGDLNDSFRPALLTAFALYDDGTVIRRVHQTTLREIKLAARLRNRLIGVLRIDRIAAAAKQTPALDIGDQALTPGHVSTVELHVWIDGSAHTMTIRGVTTADLELCTLTNRCPNPQLLKGKALLPDTLNSLIKEMFQFPFPSGHELCREAACFSRNLTLPSQEAWTSH